MTYSKPAFLFGYWRPWNENSSFTESYMNYVKDTSLVKYGADIIGKYIQTASKDQINAINKLGREIGRGVDILSDKLDDLYKELRFLNSNTEILVEQQKLSNVLLENIIELLKVPDSEKERKHAIELGVKFFISAEKDDTLFDDSLKQFQKAESLMSQDYFVLYRIGCIYLYSVNHLNIEKAREYFLKAAKYSILETDPDAIELATTLSESSDIKDKRIKEIQDYLNSIKLQEHPELLNLNVIGFDFDAINNKVYFKVIRDLDNCLKGSFEKIASLVVIRQQVRQSILKDELGIGYYKLGILMQQLQIAEIISPWKENSLHEVLVKDEIALKEKLKEIQRNPTLLKKIASIDLIQCSMSELKNGNNPTLDKEFEQIISQIENINSKHQYYGNDVIKIQTSEALKKAAFCSYVLGDFDDAVKNQKKALELYYNHENLFYLAKYECRSKQVNESLIHLESAIDLLPEIALAVFKEYDLFSTHEVLKMIEQKNEQINGKINKLIENWTGIKSLVSIDEITQLKALIENSIDVKIKKYLDSENSFQTILVKIEKLNVHIDELINSLKEFKTTAQNREVDELIIKLEYSKNLPYEELVNNYAEAKNRFESLKPQIGKFFNGGIVFHLDESGKHGLVLADINYDTAIWGASGKFNTNIEIGTGKFNTEKIVKEASFTKETKWFKSVEIPVLTAAKICQIFSHNGFDDWYLPSIDELKLIFENIHKTQIKSFRTDNFYWSSSETNEIHDIGYSYSHFKNFQMFRESKNPTKLDAFNSNNAWHMNFNDGNKHCYFNSIVKRKGLLGEIESKEVLDSSRNQKFYVIPVRSF